MRDLEFLVNQTQKPPCNSVMWSRPYLGGSGSSPKVLAVPAVLQIRTIVDRIFVKKLTFLIKFVLHF